MPFEPLYAALDDPYCYKGTKVLKNREGLRDQHELDQFEALMVTIQSSEPLPDGALDARHYRAIHRHLFGPVYRWAGKDRTIRIAKDESMFCFPEQIERQMEILFTDLARADHLRGRDADAFAAGAAHVLSELNVIHPFREGNGRAQKAFLMLLAERSGHAVDVGRIDRQEYLEAMIAAFNGDEVPLTLLLRSLL